MPKSNNLKLKGLSLQRRLLISSLIGAIPLLIFGIILLFTWFSERRTVVMDSNEQQAKMAAIYLDEWLQGHMRTLKTLAQSSEAVSGDLIEIHGLLERQNNAQPDWDHLFVTDVSGMEIVNTAEKFADVSDRPYFIEAKATMKPTVSSLITSRSTGSKVIIIAYPLLKDGAFNGVIAASILPDAIDSLFSIHLSARTHIFSLWDRQGTLLVRSGDNTELTGKEYQFPNSDMIFSGKDGQSVTLSPFNGQANMVGFATVHVAAWTVVSASSEQTTMMPIYRQIVFFILLALLIIIVTLWWQVHSAGIISRQVRQLALGAQEIGAGHLTTRINLKSGDELGLLAESINKMAVDLAMQERLKSDFLSLMSHELKTPLTTVRAFLEMMSSGTVTAESEHYPEMVKSADRQARKLQDMIENILSIARLEFGGLSVIPRPTQLKRIIDSSIEQYQELAKMKKINLHTENIADRKVNADPNKTMLILNNLLDNAVKFTDEGGEITVQTIIEANEAVITVTDNGIGMASEVRARLFEAFLQREPLLTRSFGGAGLGLPVARALVDAHGGHLSATSDGPGKGSTFSFTLPLAK